MNSVNPLASFFRQPSIFLTLPSKGKYWTEGTINLPANGELPIYPSTISDEIMLKTPDALLNGSTVTHLISSCCPSITDPWSIPACDLDAILIAIRIASEGSSMDISSTCQHCKHENESVVDLNLILDQILPVSGYFEPYDINGITIQFKPQLYKNINQTNIATFNQQKLVSNILSSELSEEEKKGEFDKGFKELAALNLDIISSSIASITADNGIEVSDVIFIKEMLSNVSKTQYANIKDKANELAAKCALSSIEIKCEECSKTYSTALEFEQSNFFG